MGRLRRAVLVSVLLTAALTACGPDKGLPAAKGLPPQDTLAGGMAPSPSYGTGGGAAVPPPAGVTPATSAAPPTASPASAAGAGQGAATGAVRK